MPMFSFHFFRVFFLFSALKDGAPLFSLDFPSILKTKYRCFHSISSNFPIFSFKRRISAAFTPFFFEFPIFSFQKRL